MSRVSPGGAFGALDAAVLGALLMALPASGASAQGPGAHGYGGGPRTRAPLRDEALTVRGAATWGRYRDQGTHDRVTGQLSLVGWATPWLSIGGRVAGALDLHPDDDRGSDQSLQGEPALLLGASYRRERWGAGLLLDLRFPGAGAPSLDPAAITPELRLWGGLRSGRAQLMANLGYRHDRTGTTIDDADALRPGDRRALLVNDPDAVLIGLAASMRWGRVEPLIDVSWEPWVGTHPGLRFAPLRLAAALRVHLDAWAVTVGVEARLTANAPVATGSEPRTPLEPRARLFAELRWGWSPASPPAPEAAQPSVPVEPPAMEEAAAVPEEPAETVAPEPIAPSAMLRGLVRNFAGDPVDAAIRVGEHESRTDPDGRFTLELESGRHEVVIEAEGYRPQSRAVRVEENGVTILNIELYEAR